MTLWGGRFVSRLDPLAWELNASLGFDRRLARQDVRGSLAWAKALAAAGVLTADECAQLRRGLEAIDGEFAAGTFTFRRDDEDIHTAVERRLGEIIGPLAGKLHTGRSRNDQVATDFRLWMLDQLPVLEAAVREMQAALLECAEDALTPNPSPKGREAEGEDAVLMPGYTHLQRAQPILLSHWWLSHFWPLQRDRQRLADLARRVAILPLGSGALAGCPFPIDRAALAAELGFVAPSPNSLDAVSDRDFVAEFLFCATMIGVHLSKLAEAVVLFTTPEFSFFELSDAYSTGSSLMPQKKNPDLFELTRGKTGTLIGLLTGMLATLKGLPSTYDKDLQEDKPPVFAAFDMLTTILPVLAGALRTLTVKSACMEAGLDAAMLATDLADYLVERGVPFREAHSLAGRAVRLAVEKGVTLDSLSVNDFQTLHPAFGADVHRVFDPAQSVARRKAIGGTAPEAVQAQLTQAKSILQA